MNPIHPPVPAGQWEPVFDLENVAIHAHLLPNGKVLYWGRRSVVGDPLFASLNEHFCSTFLWDPVAGRDVPTAQPPQLDSGESVNLFCSGHSFLPDGRLLVVGGHLFDMDRSAAHEQRALVSFRPGAARWRRARSLG
jgi:galactose oxidase